tara:strand:+ start:5221 stop:5346 length:126 start_codon:yes stop_codon:yes gene_type:complete
VTDLLRQARRELGIIRMIGECILVPAALIVLIAVLLIIGKM